MDVVCAVLARHSKTAIWFFVKYKCKIAIQVGAASNARCHDLQFAHTHTCKCNAHIMLLHTSVGLPPQFTLFSSAIEAVAHCALVFLKFHFGGLAAKWLRNCVHDAPLSLLTSGSACGSLLVVLFNRWLWMTLWMQILRVSVASPTN